LTDRPLPRRPLAPSLGEWQPGWPIYRCHRSARAPRAFNPGTSSQRFRPIRDEHGRIVPTLYGADILDGAFAETVLRDVPLDGDDRYVLADRLAAYSYSVMTSSRPLRLAILHDPEVKRLRVDPARRPTTHGQPRGRMPSMPTRPRPTD
jgi:RES domain